MTIPYLDIGLLVVMLISGLLAMVRGFLREVFSIAAWIIAALVTIYSYARLLPAAKQYINNDILASIAVIAGVFLLTLLIVSVITVRISDAVLDSRVGALDRTMGFLFGLARGLLVVVVAFMFFVWLVPERSQPAWVRDAKSRVVLQSTGEWLISISPDFEELYARYKRQREQQGEPPDAAPGANPGRGAELAPSRPGGDTTGYGRSDRVGMKDLIESKTR